MRRFLSLILIAVLALPALAAGSDPRAKALAIPTGSPVEVRLTDNTKVRGRLIAITDVDLELQSVSQAGVATERIPFDKVKSIRDTRTKTFGESVMKGFAIAGIVGGIVVVVIVAVCAHSCGG